MALLLEKENMKMRNKVMAKWVLIIIGMTMGIECLGRTFVPMITVRMDRIYYEIIDYRAREGEFPASLDALTQRPYSLKKEDLVDPWGEAFGYDYNKDEYVVWSSGPDKKKGTADDIVKGFPPSYEESWKAKNLSPVEEQKTNAGQEAASSSQVKGGGGVVSPPVRIVSKNEPQPEPTESKSAPWKLPLLIGVVVLGGVVTAWRCLNNKKKT